MLELGLRILIAEERKAMARKAMALPESARVIDLACYLHALKGAFHDVGVDPAEVEGLLDGLNKECAEDRSIALKTPGPRYREQLRKWSQLYLDSVEGS